MCAHPRRKPVVSSSKLTRSAAALSKHVKYLCKFGGEEEARMGAPVLASAKNRPTQTAGRVTSWGVPQAHEQTQSRACHWWRTRGLRGRMAARADGVLPVRLQLLAHRRGLVAGPLRQTWNVGRWRRGRGSEQRFEDPFATQNGAGPRGVRADREDRGHRQQAATVGTGGHVEALRLLAEVLRWDVIEPGELVADDRVRSVEEMR